MQVVIKGVIPKVITCNFFISDINKKSMKTLLQYSGAIVVLLGVIFLLIYAFAVPSNALLVTALVLEVVGILGYIVVNRYIE